MFSGFNTTYLDVTLCLLTLLGPYLQWVFNLRICVFNFGKIAVVSQLNTASLLYPLFFYSKIPVKYLLELFKLSFKSLNSSVHQCRIAGTILFNSLIRWDWAWWSIYFSDYNVHFQYVRVLLLHIHLFLFPFCQLLFYNPLFILISTIPSNVSYRTLNTGI